MLEQKGNAGGSGSPNWVTLASGNSPPRAAVILPNRSAERAPETLTLACRTVAIHQVSQVSHDKGLIVRLQR